ncbi:MAG TPA: cation-transporting P-type ATPase [Syntrophorhabdaceae bacterium]|nr:cation-transporting P-type ATPase [Syntrophorhabdaceae bacterium]
MNNFNWHTMSIDEILKRLESSFYGISNDEAKSRLLKYGPNELVEMQKRSPLMMFLDQFKDFMILVLIGAAIISGFIGELSDTIAIIVIIVINGVIGFV